MNTKHELKAVIFQSGDTISKDKTGKDIAYIHTGELTVGNVKKDVNKFLGAMLKAYFMPSVIVVSTGKDTSYTINGESKVSQLKGLKITFQIDGKQILLTNKAKVNSCIGKGLASLNFAKLAYQLLGLIAEVTEDKDLLTAVAVTFKADGKTDAEIKALKDESKVEIGKTGVKYVAVAIRTVRKEVKEHSQYGEYVTRLQESKKLLKAAEAKQLGAPVKKVRVAKVKAAEEVAK